MKSTVCILLSLLCLTHAGAMSLYVAQNGQTPAPPYATWADAASNIQDAVNIAFTNATVWVGAGRYTVPTNAVAHHNWTNVVYINRPLTLRSSNDAPDSVLIDGEGAWRGIAVRYGVSTTNRFVISGLTISNCFAMDPITNNNRGGGLLFDTVSATWTATVQRCVVVDNTVLATNAYGDNIWQGAAGGGGLCFYHTFSYSGLIISNCVFRGNVATNSVNNRYAAGGGICLRMLREMVIADTELADNLAGDKGGGVFCEGHLDIQRCVIHDNGTVGLPTAGSGGGGIYQLSGATRMYNSLMYSNSAPMPGGAGTFGGGGGIAGQGDDNTIYSLLVNCTIAGNRSVGAGAGVWIRTRAGAQPGIQMYNSIVVSNSMSMTAPANQTNIAMHCYYPPAGNDLTGAGNITNNPGVMFKDYAAADFRLLAGSPGVNAGSNAPWIGTRDLDGRTRIDRYSGVVDMGCYELTRSGSIVRVH